MANRSRPAAVTDDVAALPFWEAADEVLSWPGSSARVVRPAQVIAKLRPLLRTANKSVADAPSAAPDVDDLIRDVASGGAPNLVFAGTTAFADAVACVRCRIEQPASAVELMTMRAYLDAAVVADSRPTLIVDHAATREQLSFIALLIEPHRFESMRAAFKAFRATFVAAYAGHHRQYWKTYRKLSRSVEALAPSARALAALNTLRTLGPPIGEDTFVEYQRISGAPVICPVDNPADALATRPICGYCGLTLADAVPIDQHEAIAHKLRAALVLQQQRLASEAVRRILARGGERLGRFIAIVQAADTASLATVLDAELLTFIQELLDQPVSPTLEALQLFERIALAHPVITEDEIDGVVETVRRLLQEQLSARRAGDAPVPSFYLAAPQ